MNPDYSKDFFAAVLPAWVQRADGVWERAWEVTFAASPSEELLASVADLSEASLQVRLAPASSPRTIKVTMTVTHDPLSDDHFVWAPRRLHERLEKTFGAIDTIFGQPREWFGTF